MQAPFESLQNRKLSSIIERDFWSEQHTVIENLRKNNPQLPLDIGQIQVTRTNHFQIDILKQISARLTSKYGTHVDALTWFVVLYHGTNALERYTYREIEELLRLLGAFHIGRDDREVYYNNTSIRRLLVQLGWESFHQTEHTQVGKTLGGNKRSSASGEKIEKITDMIRMRIPNIRLPEREDQEPSTHYADRISGFLEQYYPEIQSLGRRVRAQVLNALTGRSDFTPDSFRQRVKGK